MEKYKTHDLRIYTGESKEDEWK